MLHKVFPFLRWFPVNVGTSPGRRGNGGSGGDENLFGSSEMALQTLQAKLPGE